MKVVAFSSGDAAGCNIARMLKDEFNVDDGFFVESSSSITGVGSLGDVNPEVCIVASRHRSESGQPTLTAHAAGNFGTAGLGGRDSELSIAPALYLREAVLGFMKYGAGSGYSVSLEVTHHGPTALPYPILFVEVGSTLKHWNDLDACRIAARVINDLLAKEPELKEVALGFGGPHYAPNFTGVLNEVALGHIASKHVAGLLDESMIRQMVEKTIPKPSLALLDWKGLHGVERRKLIDILGVVGLPWKRTSEFKQQ